MNSPRLDLAEKARRELRDIEAWIAEHDGEMRAAAFVERIWKTMHNLAAMPGIGSSRHYLGKLRRAFPVPPWVVIYRPLPDDEGILVQRIVDGRRNLAAIFRSTKPSR